MKFRYILLDDWGSADGTNDLEKALAFFANDIAYSVIDTEFGRFLSSADPVEWEEIFQEEARV